MNRWMLNFGCWILGVALLATVSSRAADVEVGVTTLEGEEKSGKLQNISEAEVQLESGKIAIKDVASISFPAKSAPSQSGTSIYLRNNDVLNNASIVSGDDSKVKIKSDAFGEMTLENKFIHAMVFPAKDKPSNDAIDAFLKGPKPKEDLLLMPKGDTVSGYVEKFSDKEITFNSGGQSRVYAFDKVVAFRLAPLDEYKAREGVLGTIELRDGTVVTGKLQEVKDASLKFEAMTGQSWGAALETISGIRFKGGKMVYLSDLKPGNVQEKSFIGGAPVVYHWRKDRIAGEGKLSINGKEYARGISMHSYCKLTYNIDGQYAKLLADVGMPGADSSPAACEWKILVDGKQAGGGVVKVGDKAQSLKIDLAGAKQLELICDFGPDNDDAGDHLIFGNARLIKP